MRHAILGAGGVGGLIGACLAKSGHSVTMVVRPQAAADYPSSLTLESPFGNFSVPVEHGVTVPECDVLWVTVKATQLEPALDAIKDVKSIGAIVPLLNGIDHVALLRFRYGYDLVVPATIAVETERAAAGHIIHRSPFARVQVSSLGRGWLAESLEQLKAMGFECKFVDDEQTLLWSKLVFLAPLALTTTAAMRTKGEVTADPAWNRQLQECVREACAVAKAEEAKVNPDAILTTIAGLPAGMRSSMQKDVQECRVPELDAIGGPILRRAERNQMMVPVTQKLVDTIRAQIGVTCP